VAEGHRIEDRVVADGRDLQRAGGVDGVDRRDVAFRVDADVDGNIDLLAVDEDRQVRFGLDRFGRDGKDPELLAVGGVGGREVEPAVYVGQALRIGRVGDAVGGPGVNILDQLGAARRPVARPARCRPASRRSSTARGRCCRRRP